MTPLNPQQPRNSSSGFVTGLSIGLAITLALACVTFGAGWAWVQKKSRDARKGWNLVPVVVAAQDIAEGTPVAMEMISQRSVPEQFVTSSVVQPHEASSMVNQPVRVPVKAGDPLYWTQFDRSLWSHAKDP